MIRQEVQERFHVLRKAPTFAVDHSEFDATFDFFAVDRREGTRAKLAAEPARGGWCLLQPKDLDTVCLHFRELSDDAFRKRFSVARSLDWLEQYLDEFFKKPGFAIGTFRSRQLIAIGEARPSMMDPGAICEFGLSVADDERGCGLGLEMAYALRRLAKLRGYQSAEAFVECSNKPMRAVLGHFESTCSRSGASLHYRMPL